MKTYIHRLSFCAINQAIRRGLFLAVLLCGVTSLLEATDTTISGNLTVSPGSLSVSANATVSGNTTLTNDLDVGWAAVTFSGTKVPNNLSGTWQHFNLDLSDVTVPVGATTYIIPGLNLGVSNGTLKGVVFTGYSSNTTWTWQHGLTNVVGSSLYFNGTPSTQMNLTDAGVLTLFEAFDGNATHSNITFDPGNQSIAFSQNGTVLAGITHTNTTIVLSGSGVAFGTGTSTGTGAIALGNHTTAIGNGAIALGTNISANTWDGVTVGHFNTGITGCSSAWASTDPAFIVGIGQNSTTTANGLVVLNNGIIYAGNSTNFDSATGLPQGTGTRLMWIPQTESFLAGTPYNGTTWNYSNIGTGTVVIGNNQKKLDNGNGSILLGYNDTDSNSGIAIGGSDTATGNGTVALGYGSGANTDGTIAIGQLTSTGSYSSYGGIAMGWYSSQWGSGSLAFGFYNNSSGLGSIALGYENGPTSGNGSVALGKNNLVSGDGANGIGNSNMVSGNNAVAIGGNNSATDVNTIAMGGYNTVVGNGAVALGSNNSVSGNGTIVLGSNLTVGNVTTNALVVGQWAGAGCTTINSTVLFVLGNGTGNGITNGTTLNTAFTVYQNGNMTITKRQGDIVMGEFGNGGGD